MNKTMLLSLASAVVLAAGCGGPAARIKKNPLVFSTYAPETQEDIRAGRIRIGFSKDQVQLALGDPDYRYARTTETGFREVWVYSDSDLVPVGSVYRRPSFDPAFRSTDEEAGGEKSRLLFQDGKLVVIERRQ